MDRGHREADQLQSELLATDPDNTFALTSLGLAYLRLSPPEADKGLGYLNRALQIGKISQSKIAGDNRLVLSPVYEGLGDGYLTRASQLNTDKLGSDVWQQKKEAYANAVKYFGLGSKAPSGFASSDARVLSRFAEACEGLAQMDEQELAAPAPEWRESLIRERDELRSKSEEAMRHAREVLAVGNVSSIDPNYRTVMIGQGNIIFGREVGASNEEKVDYYRQALVAVYVECKDRADLFLTSLANYDKRYKVRGKAVDGWAMTEKHMTEYTSDREVKHIRIEFKDENWWIDRARSAAASK